MKKKMNNRKTRRLHKKIYRGGTFVDDFEENLRKIRLALEFSGRHTINRESAEIFINSQISVARRQAARDLIDNTVYITLAETFEIVEQLITRLYEENRFNETTEPIYFNTSDPSKSNYFLSIIAMFYIRQKGYREPIFIKGLNDQTLDEVGTNPLIIIDDMSYSGSQLSEQLYNIYYFRKVKKGDAGYIPNIFVLLTGLNNVSLRRLSRVPIRKSRGDIYIDFIENPFHIMFLPERLYEPLLLKLGIERYFYLNVFFSPYNMHQGFSPHVSVYLDHKVADVVSTHLRALVYGPIVPANYDYNKIIDYIEEGYVYFSFPFGTTDEEKTMLIEKFNRENGTAFKNVSDISEMLTEKLKGLDVIDEDSRELNHLTFSPFINECKDSPEVISIISDPEIINLNYCFFISDEDFFTKDLMEGELMEELMQEFGLEKSKVLEIIKKIDEVRCPVSWYKKGPLQMVQH